jgi:endo-beta-N-acetylglucosaminidase D
VTEGTEVKESVEIKPKKNKIGFGNVLSNRIHALSKPDKLMKKARHAKEVKHNQDAVNRAKLVLSQRDENIHSNLKHSNSKIQSLSTSKHASITGSLF